MKRLCALILAILMLVPLVSSCMDNGGSGNDSTRPATEAPDSGMEGLRSQVSDDLPDIRYDGKTFTVLIRTDAEDLFFFEEQTGENVDDAIYYRDMSIEERFGLELNYHMEAGGWNDQANYLDVIKSSVTAGDEAFDLIEGYAAYIGTFAGEKLFGNWLDLEYTDLSKPWWYSQLSDEFTIDNCLFFVSGDYALSLWLSMYVMLFNKKLCEDFRVDDLYAIVESGEWTLDKLEEVTSDLYSDINGNTKIDEYDVFGFSTATGGYMDAIQIMFDFPVTVKDEDGIPNLNLHDEKLSTIATALCNMLYRHDGIYAIPESGTSDATTYNMFKQDQVVISPQYLSAVQSLREMESEFGIIPFPKFDEKQEDYISTSQDGFSMLCFPIVIQDEEMTSIITTALFAESYKKVIPQLYDVSLKSKHTRDDESGEMLDLIRDRLTLNFGAINSSAIGGPAQLLRMVITNKNDNISSLVETYYDAIEKKLDKLMDAYLDRD